MDNYIPPNSSSSPTEWEENSDMYQRAFWLDAAEPLADAFLLDSGGNLNLGESTLPSENQAIYELAPQHMASKDLLVPRKQESNISQGSFPLLSGPLGEEFNGSCTSESAPCALTNPVSLKTDDLDRSVYPPSVEGSDQLPVAQHFWASPLPSANMGNFGFHEQPVGIYNSDLGSTCVEYDKHGEIQDFSRIFKVEQHDGPQGIYIPDISHGFVAESAQGFGFEPPHQPLPLPLLLPPADLYPTENFQTQPLANVSQPAPANTMRARVRARRGQATDPHSIAERLRREKISERMKNLRELVPNASKTDKASMLEEIIDYVKFLQLQVKVLSMSRLGAAHGISSSLPADVPSREQSEDAVAEEDNHREKEEYGRAESGHAVEAEKEVMNLLESNVNMAMQVLQSKGLCLMPVALASAIAAFKGSAAAAAAPLDRSKPQLTDPASLPVRACICRAKEENEDNNCNDNVKEFRPNS